MPEIRAITETDNVIVYFSYGLFRDGADIGIIIKNMDDCGVGKDDIIYCTEINDQEKIEFIKAIDIQELKK
ncbi:hypothetical protein KAR91_02335 [Candidatus Pacearchaeota archaeon]|nr:hypothetical protein [Candidatus Pacearchaeota archaeon]